VSLVIDVRDEGVAAVVLSGELDAFTSRLLRDRLVGLFEEGQADIVIDLTDVDFIDSTAAGVLVGALRRARAAGGDVHLRGPSAATRQVFEVSGLARLFSLE
jgi:anti-sigma B factor antagonist